MHSIDIFLRLKDTFNSVYIECSTIAKRWIRGWYEAVDVHTYINTCMYTWESTEKLCKTPRAMSAQSLSTHIHTYTFFCQLILILFVFADSNNDGHARKRVTMPVIIHRRRQQMIEKETIRWPVISWNDDENNSIKTIRKLVFGYV